VTVLTLSVHGLHVTLNCCCASISAVMVVQVTEDGQGL